MQTMNELVVLQNADQILNAMLAATLAGLSIMAAALLGPVRESIRGSISKLEGMVEQPTSYTEEFKNSIRKEIEIQKENLSSASNCGINLINAFYFFVTALFLMFGLDTYGVLYSENLFFEIADISLSGTPLIIGLRCLWKGAKSLKSIYLTELQGGAC